MSVSELFHVYLMGNGETPSALDFLAPQFSTQSPRGAYFHMLWKSSNELAPAIGFAVRTLGTCCWSGEMDNPSLLSSRTENFNQADNCIVINLQVALKTEKEP